MLRARLASVSPWCRAVYFVLPPQGCLLARGWRIFSAFLEQRAPGFPFMARTWCCIQLLLFKYYFENVLARRDADAVNCFPFVLDALSRKVEERAFGRQSFSEFDLAFDCGDRVGTNHCEHEGRAALIGRDYLDLKDSFLLLFLLLPLLQLLL